MKSYFAPALLTLALLLEARPLLANAVTAQAAAPAEVKEALPAGAQIAALEVQPEKVVLGGKYEAAQLVVTARLGSGEAVDATRLVAYSVNGDGSLAEVTKSGQVKPVRDGAGTLHIEIAGQKTSVPIEVRGVAGAQPIDFIRDVNPVLTRMGCNAGTCHGAKDGKAGFKLSLRGYDPIFDVRSFKDDLAGRRLNAASPDDSLMLLKATAGVPHEGGQKTKVGEKYYEIIRGWIADGAKLDLAAPRVTKIDVFPHNPVVQQIGVRQQVRIVATYADGKARDVTAEAFVESGNTDVASTDGGGLIQTLRRGEAPLLARFEGAYAATTLTVMGDRNGFEWKSPETWSRIDDLVAAKWERMKILPSELCRDDEFIRRVYLDLTGLPPSADEVRAFLADTRETKVKRDEVIDRLVGSADYIDHWTNRWASLLQVNSKFLGGEGAKLFREWIRKEVEANTPYDQFVRKLLTATGSNRENPAGSYFKVLRVPEETMENTTHLFLGTRFNCNKCHDHPFERWTQDQYYQLTAFFAQVDLQRDPASGKAKIEGSAVEKATPLFEIIGDRKEGETKHDRTGKVTPPEFPYAVPATLSASLAAPEQMPAPTRREQLAAWMTSAENRTFTASYVNRVWGYLLGVGLIEPLDDIRAGNPPTNPELLDHLTRDFVEHKFDVRHLVRTICKSRTYQLSLHANRWNEDDKINYSHATARRLPAEVLYDAVIRATGSKPRIAGAQPGIRASQLPDVALDATSGFLATLGRPARESSCECERSNDVRLGAVMSLLTGPAVAEAIGDAGNELAKLTQKQPDDRALIDELFLRVLNRHASEGEVQKTLQSWSGIDAESAAIATAVAAKEAEQAPLIAAAEKQRLEAIEKAKADLAAFEQQIAPKRAEEEKARQEKIAAAEKAVKDFEPQLANAQEVWERALPLSRTWTAWEPADVKAANANAGVRLEKQSDGSYLAVGGGGQPEFNLAFESKLPAITGIMIEVLPDATLPKTGPGRAGDGNFVISEAQLEWAPSGKQIDDARFADAFADFSQDKFDAKLVVDGKATRETFGWAVSPQAGVPHFLALKLAKPLGDANGARFNLKLLHRYGDTYFLGRFRLWVTTSPDIAPGVPSAVSAALKTLPTARTAEQRAALATYYRTQDPELRTRGFALQLSKNPLPEDPGVSARKAAIAEASKPIKLDPQLVQLRQDFEQSKAQLANRRLTGAQDLAWALINTPSFLFNR